MHDYDPWISVGYNQKELERILKLILNVQFEVRRLKGSRSSRTGRIRRNPCTTVRRSKRNWKLWQMKKSRKCSENSSYPHAQSVPTQKLSDELFALLQNAY